MSNIEIKQLYNHNRFPENGNKFFYLLLYTPIGIILLTLRAILGLCIYLISYILPDTHIVQYTIRKLICFTFGIVIDVENPDKKEDVEAFISNQVSIFDSIAVHFSTRCITNGIKLNPLLSSILGITCYDSSSSFEEFKRTMEHVSSKTKVPLFFQPESLVTNGKALLKFNTFPFAVFSKMQPLTIKVYRPGIEIPVSIFDSSCMADILYFMFLPCTIYKLKYLSPIEKKDMSESNYSEKVRQDIAHELKIELTNYSAADLKEFKKRYKIEQQRPIQQLSNPSVSPELHRMTLQVREVLPLVPYNAVYKDLSKTRSVDITITNILEGHVQYIPEQPKPSSSKTVTTQTRSNTNANESRNPPSSSTQAALNTSATSFGKSSQERTLSFQERKKQLIESAKKRYIEKHDLNIVGS